MIKSTGIYIRVSTEEQVVEGYSMRAQEEKLRSYALAKEWPVFNVYMDEGISAKNIEGRPAVRQLIADVESGKINNVLVYKVDRLTRSTKNLIEFVELFNQHDCSFNSLNESIDTATATGRMFLKIVGIFAEFERENLAERVRFGFERKAKEGYSLCSNIKSYGYSRANGQKIQTIDDEEAAIVRRIFDMYLNDNYSFFKISQVLNAENIPTKLGNKWFGITVKATLTNPNHVGKVRYSCRDKAHYFETDGQHEAIVSETMFNAAQEKIGRTKKISPTKRPSSGVYFCGIAYCPQCGCKYTPIWSYKEHYAGAPKYPSYHCDKAPKGHCGNTKTISHTRLEAAFGQYINQIADFTVDGGEGEIHPPRDSSAEIAEITAEIERLEKKTKEVMNLFMSSKLSFDAYQSMVSAGESRRGELEARLNRLQDAAQTSTAGYTRPEIAANFRENWAGLNNDQRQQFVQRFIKKIIVHSEPPKSGRYNEVVIDEVIFNEF